MSFVASYLKRFLPRELGVISSDYTLLSIDTGINVVPGTGTTITIALPANPSPGQIVVINNTGIGTVVVTGNGRLIGGSASITIPSGGSVTFVNAGDSTFGSVTIVPDWVVLNSDCSYVLPASKIDGTNAIGPFATPPALPPNQLISSDITTFCDGLLLLKHVVDVQYSVTSNIAPWSETILTATRLSSSYFTNTDMPDISGSLPNTTYGASACAADQAQFPIFPASFAASGATWSKMYPNCADINQNGYYLAAGGGLDGIQRQAYSLTYTSTSGGATEYYLVVTVRDYYDVI